jgi:hypothetical protein
MWTRKWVAVGAGTVVLIACGGFFAIHEQVEQSNNSASASGDQIASSFLKACQIYSFARASEILGPNTKQGDDSPPTIQGNTLVSTCSYTNGASDAKLLQVSTVLLRNSTDNSSIEGFKAAMPLNAISISGFGDDAYWSPSLGQLNILKGKNWVIISSGSGPVNERSPEQSKQVASLIIGDL